MRYYSSSALDTTLAAPISSSATSITVAATAGFPVLTPFTLAIEPETSNKELVEVTDVSGTTLTVTRGMDGTGAVAHSLGSVVTHVHSARDFREPQEHIAATVAHGATGAVVGTTNTQTLLNKTLHAPAFTGTPTGLTKTHVGLANVDNTSDANKPVSTAQSAAISSAASAAASSAQSAAIAAAAAAATAYTDAEVVELLATLGLTGKKVQMGAASINGASLAAGNGTFTAVTFAVPFSGSGTPYVFVSMAGGPGGSSNIVARTAGVTNATGFNLYAYNAGASAATWTNLVVNWIAIGDA